MMMMISNIPTSLTSLPYQTTVTTSSLPKPPKFKPGPFDVICARGKQAYNHDGNKHFRVIVSNASEKYSKVESKLQRSMIVTDIIDVIREKGNGFLRKNDSTGEWMECSDVLVREKVGQYFRAALGSRFKSRNSVSMKQSKKIKNILPSVVAILQQQQHQQQQQSVLLSSTKEKEDEEEDLFPPPLLLSSSSVSSDHHPVPTSTSTNYDTTTTSYCIDRSTSSNSNCKYRTSSTIPTTLTNLVVPDYEDDDDNDGNQDDIHDNDDNATTESNGSSFHSLSSSNKVFNRTFFDTDEDDCDDYSYDYDSNNNYAIPQWIGSSISNLK